MKEFLVLEYKLADDSHISGVVEELIKAYVQRLGAHGLVQPLPEGTASVVRPQVEQDNEGNIVLYVPNSEATYENVTEL